MVDDVVWTPLRVGDCLVLELIAMQGAALILSRSGRTGHLVMDATTECLPEKSFGRKQLLSWANCQARGTSFSEICREFGWNRSTAERHIAQAKVCVAAKLNGRDKSA